MSNQPTGTMQLQALLDQGDEQAYAELLTLASTRLQKLARFQLLILDDWGLNPLKDADRRDLLEILEDRHDISSTIIASQMPISKWHDTIGDPTIADAILDRVVHNAHKIELKGESVRKIKSKVD